ncbi:MAG: hypothetical protein ETSY2_24030 [Candidatus Entotheonella gemina]|uniref:Uncharacterized protein n=1 Tax=Candidatus Entotheonella gemina TaxID=1429439 RepID=W4M6I7_9BACT|nr:MAG: hypothetical protein ETSY2_24030 [Candidatus Entotheonella gemina]
MFKLGLQSLAAGAADHLFMSENDGGLLQSARGFLINVNA